MIRRGLALPILGLALALLLAAEWLLPGPAGPGWLPPPAIPSTLADGSSDADAARWAGIILARPLLSQSRRPAAQPGMAADDTLPRLSAIIVIGGTRRAIFSATGEKPRLVSEGGEIGLYRIKSVGIDRVDLLGPNGPLTLRPQFLAAAPAAQAPHS